MQVQNNLIIEICFDCMQTNKLNYDMLRHCGRKYQMIYIKKYIIMTSVEKSKVYALKNKQ